MGKKGEITVFLCMVLLLVSAAICALLETARTAASDLYFQMAARSGLESCFGEYYRPLWQKYHLLFVYEEEPLEDRMKEYLKYYQNPGQETESAGLTFLSFSEAEIQRQQANYLTDQGGFFLQESGGDYIKYHMAAQAAEDLLDQVGVIRQIRSAADFVKKLSEYAEKIWEAEERIRKICDLAEQISKLSKETAREMENLVEDIRALVSQVPGELSEREAAEQLNWLMEESEKKFSEDEIFGEDKLPGFLREVENYGVLAEELRENLQETSEEMTTEEYTGEIRSLMEEQVENIRTYSSEGGQRWQEIFDLKAAVTRAEETIKLCKEWGMMEISEETDLTIFLDQAEELTQKTAEALTFEIPEWMKGLGTLTEESEEYPRSRISGLTEEALLRFFVGDDIVLSDAYLPAGGTYWEKSEFQGETGQGIWDQAKSNILFQMYLTDSFSSFSKKLEDHHMYYEQEYLLGGKRTDRENLLHIAGELLLLREGIRFLEYLSDSGKCQEAAVTAAALAGATGNPIVIKLLETAILAAWALNDAAGDVQDLMRGKEVPVLTFAGYSWPSLDYSGYLKILLALMDQESVRSRCLDLIQATMRETDPEFRVDKCLYEIQVQVKASRTPIFGRLPLVQKLWILFQTDSSCAEIKFSYHS